MTSIEVLLQRSHLPLHATIITSAPTLAAKVLSTTRSTLTTIAPLDTTATTQAIAHTTIDTVHTFQSTRSPREFSERMQRFA